MIISIDELEQLSRDSYESGKRDGLAEKEQEIMEQIPWTGIYADFHDLPDAIDQIIQHIKELDRKIEHYQNGEREQCCVALCTYCADGYPAVKLDGEWYHQKLGYTPAGDRRVKCEASAIRNQEADDN